MAKQQPTTVEVKILDKEYLVACPDEARDALLQSARHLDSKMREIRASGKVFGTERIAVMAALNITHDLLEQDTMSGAARQCPYNEINFLGCSLVGFVLEPMRTTQVATLGHCEHVPIRGKPNMSQRPPTLNFGFKGHIR